MKFTKEEISLCEQIAGRFAKEIRHGVWIAEEKKKTIEVSLWNLPIGVTEEQRKEGKWTPLWQIHDCLKFLESKEYGLLHLGYDPLDENYLCKIDKYNQGAYTYEGLYKSGKTPLEACLKAVLAVLGEGR